MAGSRAETPEYNLPDRQPPKPQRTCMQKQKRPPSLEAAYILVLLTGIELVTY
jgi:hypothetical protein